MEVLNGPVSVLNGPVSASLIHWGALTKARHMVPSLLRDQPTGQSSSSERLVFGLDSSPLPRNGGDKLVGSWLSQSRYVLVCILQKLCGSNYPLSVAFIVVNEFCERFSYYGMRGMWPVSGK